MLNPCVDPSVCKPVRPGNARSRSGSSPPGTPAICTALVAAPFSRLSATTQRVKAVGYGEVFPDPADKNLIPPGRGYGHGIKVCGGFVHQNHPGAPGQDLLCLGRRKLLSVSMFTDSLWPRKTGTRTVVAVTWIVSSPRIFWVSRIIFHSSAVYPVSSIYQYAVKH